MKLSQKELGTFRQDIAGMFRWAAEQGCLAVQVHLPDDERLAQIEQARRETGVSVASVNAMSCAMLGPDPVAQAHEHRQVERALWIADRLGAPTVSNFAGRDPGKDLAGNAEEFARVYEPHARLAERLGLKICFENCPMIGGQPPIARNIAYCPAHWRALFTACDSPALGLELDVSHCLYVGLDPVRIIHDWRERIHHVQIKDCRLADDQQAEQGLLCGIPHALVPLGAGALDGPAVFDALKEIGFDGYLTGDIEGCDIDGARSNLAAIKACARTQGVALETLACVATDRQ